MTDALTPETPEVLPEPTLEERLKGRLWRKILDKETIDERAAQLLEGGPQPYPPDMPYEKLPPDLCGKCGLTVVHANRLCYDRYHKVLYPTCGLCVAAFEAHLKRQAESARRRR